MTNEHGLIRILSIPLCPKPTQRGHHRGRLIAWTAGDDLRMPIRLGIAASEGTWGTDRCAPLQIPKPTHRNVPPITFKYNGNG